MTLRKLQIVECFGVGMLSLQAWLHSWYFWFMSFSFLVSLVRSLSVVLIFSMSHLFASLIFSSTCFVFNSIDLSFYLFNFLLLAFGLFCSFSRFLSWELRFIDFRHFNFLLMSVFSALNFSFVLKLWYVAFLFCIHLPMSVYLSIYHLTFYNLSNHSLKYHLISLSTV
jgi:hypothetical protein